MLLQGVSPLGTMPGDSWDWVETTLASVDQVGVAYDANREGVSVVTRLQHVPLQFYRNNLPHIDANMHTFAWPPL